MLVNIIPHPYPNFDVGLATALGRTWMSNYSWHKNGCVITYPLLRINWPLARYVKLRVAHAPGMPGTFSPPPRISDPDMHHGTCVTHVPWCKPGSLTGQVGDGENVSGISSACTTRNFPYLVRGPRWTQVPSGRRYQGYVSLTILTIYIENNSFLVLMLVKHALILERAIKYIDLLHMLPNLLTYTHVQWFNVGCYQ